MTGWLIVIDYLTRNPWVTNNLSHRYFWVIPLWHPRSQEVFALSRSRGLCIPTGPFCIYIYGCINLRAVRSANGNIYNNIYILYLFIYIGDIQLSIIYIYNGETHPCLAGGFSSQIDSRDTSPFVIKNVWNLPHGTYLYGTANGNIYNNIYTIYNYRYIGYIQHSISLRIYIYTYVYIRFGTPYFIKQRCSCTVQVAVTRVTRLRRVWKAVRWSRLAPWYGMDGNGYGYMLCVLLLKNKCYMLYEKHMPYIFKWYIYIYR